MTASHDGYVRIFTEEGKLKANINVNHPLPMSWDIGLDPKKKLKKKIFYALKILDIAKYKYKNERFVQNFVKVGNFISMLVKKHQLEKKQ